MAAMTSNRRTNTIEITRKKYKWHTHRNAQI